MTATPRPQWYVDENSTFNTEAKRVVQIPGDGSAIVHGYNVTANAALIVQAVNTHERAKAVLQLLLDEYGEGGMLDGQPIIAQAKALLADMEG